MKKKIDLILWALIWIMPLGAWLLTIFRSGTAATDFSSFMYDWSFSLVRDTINNAWSLAFNESLYIAPLISYLVSVEIVHCFFDALVFIPRFAHACIDKFVGIAEGDKK